MKKDYSIECAQEYGVNDSDKNSVLKQALEKIISKLEMEGDSYSLVLQVDDMTGPGSGFDFKTYEKWLENNGYKPDLIIRESQIKSVCDKFIKTLNLQRLNPKLTRSLNGSPSDSLFVATWCLIRLGYLSSDDFPSDLRANNLINILPISFKLCEDESLEIIKASPHAKAAKQIQYQFV